VRRVHGERRVELGLRGLDPPGPQVRVAQGRAQARRVGVLAQRVVKTPARRIDLAGADLLPGPFQHFALPAVEPGH
jgi:hypothetical protein